MSPDEKSYGFEAFDFSTLLNSSLTDKARAILNSIQAAQKSFSIYPPGHPVVEKAVTGLRTLLNNLTENGKITFSLIKEQLFINELPLPEESKSYQELLTHLSKLKIRNLIFLNGIEQSEAASFISILNLDQAEVTDRGGLQRVFIDHNLARIKIIEFESDRDEKDEKKKNISGIYKELTEAFDDLLEDFAKRQVSGLNLIKSLIHNLVEVSDEKSGLMFCYATQKNYTKYLTFHSVNVMFLSLCLGVKAGLDRHSLSLLGLAALLHDIGKIKIPKNILLKNEVLTGEEWDMVKKHPVYGAGLTLEARGLTQLTMIVALEHHMGFDLSGYPSLSHSRKPHFFSRLVEVADTFEAMTSRRPFRPALTPPEALTIMASGRGKKLDPYLTSEFIKMAGFYPAGTLLKLVSGETGFVMDPNHEDLRCPVVKPVLSALGEKTEKPERCIGSQEIAGILDPSLLKMNFLDHLPEETRKN